VSANLAGLGIEIKPDGPIEQRVACPQCAKGGRDDALGVNILTCAYHCFRCGWKGRAGGEMREHRPAVRIHDSALIERKRERLRRTWRESLPLSHPKAHAVREYLKARALGAVLDAPPSALRAHPRLMYWDGAYQLGAYPAMIALFCDAHGKPVTLHATFLAGNGCAKADVPKPKKILGTPIRGATNGGAIRLHRPRNGALGVAEGIESALSLSLLNNVPVWAAYCADNLPRIQIPEEVRTLYIGVDVDESGKGQTVAQALAERAARLPQHPQVSLVRPEGTGPGDLNDMLRRSRPA
jgi:putative DNA primase/helicase